MSGKKMTAEEMKTMLAELKKIDAEIAAALEAMQGATQELEANVDELLRKRARAMGVAEREIRGSIARARMR
jgi:hypothetical protein